MIVFYRWYGIEGARGKDKRIKGKLFVSNFFSFLSLKDTIIVILIKPKTKELNPY